MSSAGKRRDYLLIATVVVGLYSVLMIRYPIIYGADTIARLITFPKILNGHQLPLLQMLIYLALSFAYHPAAVFLLMALISAAACTGLYALTYQLSGHRVAGFLAATFYATHAFILYYSRVPYQESLLVAGTTWGFYWVFRDSSTFSRVCAALWVGIACLSRYEGWIVALSAAVFEILRSRRQEGRFSYRSLSLALLAFGWAPVLWIVLNHDLSPPGTYVLDLALGLKRLYRPYFIAKSALWWTESIVALFALIGLLYTMVHESTRKDARLHAVSGFLAMYFLALLFSGHGIDPDPERILTEREAFVPITMLLLYGGFGVSSLVQAFRALGVNRAFVSAMVAIIAVVASCYGLHTALGRIAQSNVDNELKTDFEVARLLSHERAASLLLAAPIPLQPIQAYVENVARWSGARGAAAAEELLRHAETTPLDYQRVVVYSWMPREKLISGDRLPDLEAHSIGAFLKQHQICYVVVFSDFVPEAPAQKSLLSWCVERGSPVHEIRNGAKMARIFSVP
jgi:hypothetical protein